MTQNRLACRGRLPRLFCVGAWVLGLSCIPAQAGAAAIGCVIRDHSAIYARPDLFAPPLHSIAAGETCTVVADSAGWKVVALREGGLGWIPASRVRSPTTNSVINCCCAPQDRGGEFSSALLGSAIGIGATALLMIVPLEFTSADLASSFGTHGHSGVTQTTVDVAFWSAVLADVLTPGAAGYGAYSAGEGAEPGGSLWAAIGGAFLGDLLGTGAGLGVDALISEASGSSVYLPGTAVGAIFGTSFGAVTGYELSRTKESRTAAWQGRVLPPEVGLRIVDPGPDTRHTMPDPVLCGRPQLCVQAELLRLRF